MRKNVDAELAMQLGLGKDWVGTVIDDETQEVLAYVAREEMTWPDILNHPKDLLTFEAMGQDQEDDSDYWVYAVDKEAAVQLLDYLYDGKGYMYRRVEVPENLDDIIVDVTDQLTAGIS